MPYNSPTPDTLPNGDREWRFLFWAKRVWKGGEEFYECKLRTEKKQSDCPEGSRKTIIGEVVRKFGIDELPQLVVNVLHQKNMSLIWPRAIAPDEVEKDDFMSTEILKVRPWTIGWLTIRKIYRILNATMDENDKVNWGRAITYLFLPHKLPKNPNDNLESRAFFSFLLRKKNKYKVRLLKLAALAGDSVLLLCGRH